MINIDSMIKALDGNYGARFNGVYLGDVVDALKSYKELEAENARLRQQRDAANAQLDFLIEEMKKAP